MSDTMIRHTLQREQFAALAAGRGDRDVIALLWYTERSRRLLQISTLFLQAKRAHIASGVFMAAQNLDMLYTDTLVLNPQVGAWAADALRRTAHDPDDESAWGGLRTLALIAAAGTGLTWRTRLPHRDGHVMLFGRGMALFPGLGADELIEAQATYGQITLRARDVTVTITGSEEPDSAHWWSLRHLRAKGAGDLELVVSLDDLDPFRDLADPVSPERLSETALATWQALLSEAWTLLCTHHADTAEAMAAGFVSLAPLPIGDGRETRSASSGEAFGSIMVSPPPDATTLAESLVHEFQHIKLGGLMHLVELTMDDGVPRYYSPWRDDPRPIGGHLQGVYAFAGIAAFWRKHRETVSGDQERLAGFEYAYARIQAVDGLDVLRASGLLTARGREFADGLAAWLLPWLAQQAHPEIERIACLVADYHRVGWRIRHQRLRDGEADALAQAWLYNRADPLEPGVLSAEDPEIAPAASTERWSHRMLARARRRVLMPDAMRLGVASEALFDGDTQTARWLYARAVREDPSGLDAWCGLACTFPGISPRAYALHERPELVRAVYERTRSDCLGVAEWVGQALLEARAR